MPRILAIFAVSLAALALSGCGPQSIALHSSAEDVPEDVYDRLLQVDNPDAVADEVDHAIWLSNESFVFLGGGGSTCYSVPVDVSAPDSATVEVRLEWTGGDSCTLDLIYVPYEIATPATIDVTGTVTLRLIDGEAVYEYPIADR